MSVNALLSPVQDPRRHRGVYNVLLLTNLFRFTGVGHTCVNGAKYYDVSFYCIYVFISTKWLFR